MSAARCSQCSINYPASWMNCRACRGALFQATDLMPDPDWQMASDRVRAELAAAAEWAEATPTITTTIKESQGHLTISSHDVVRAGIRHRLPPETVLVIAHPDSGATEHVEVLGYSYRNRCYWVRRFAVTFPNYAPEEWILEA